MSGFSLPDRGKEHGPTSLDDALWAAAAVACHGGKPGGSQGAPTEHDRSQMADFPRHLRRQGCDRRPDRSLAVLNALLTFHPETALTGDDELIVFPVERSAGLARAWHAAGDAAAAPGGPGRLRSGDPPRQSRTASATPGKGRGVRSRPPSASISRRWWRGRPSSSAWPERSGPSGGRWPCPRADHALPARRRQDDLGRARGGCARPIGEPFIARISGSRAAFHARPRGWNWSPWPRSSGSCRRNP